MCKVKIIFRRKVVELNVAKGALVSEVVESGGFFLERACAGRGICGSCRLLAKGDLSKPTKAELRLLSKRDLKAGVRLACQAKILGEVEILLPSTVLVTDKIFEGAYPVGRLKGPFGIAVDLGTTTVGVFLKTLQDGIIHKGNAVLNQQGIYGAEVISRLESSALGKAEELKRLAERSIEDAILGLGLNEAQLSQIERAIVVGNSAMHHLLLGLPVESLMKFPFQPYEMRAKKLRWSFLGKEIEVWVPPLIGGFVGSDALACLAFLGFATKKRAMAGVDLGTNGEVMVTDGKEILVASTAAGPAFEGVNIECGMRAERGAISAVRRNEKGELELEIIKEGTKTSHAQTESPGAELKQAKGITGSGLLSLVNFLRKEGRIDENGRLREGRIFLTEQVYLSQSDVREVQKAKSAIRAGFEVLLERLKLVPGDLEELVLTGSFGAKIEVKDALDLGMIPKVKKERIKVFANAAGMGAGMMLEPSAFEFAEELAQKVKQIELYSEQKFMERFIENMKL